MLRSLKELIGYKIQAADGDIGKVEDFYFDDHQWIIRYLVDNTGTFLGRSVLISPISLGEPQWATKTFPVRMSIEQIKESPDAGAAKPVSRQKEIELVSYYEWPAYWGGAFQHMPVGIVQQAKAKEKTEAQKGKRDPNLRSFEEVASYHLRATDGDIGHVDDFIVDDTDWRIRYCVVDTRNWLPAKRVLLALDWITDVNWEEKRACVDLTKEDIKNAPRYDPATPINRKYEEHLYDFYGRPKYWT
jgi:hypothetical protein